MSLISPYKYEHPASARRDIHDRERERERKIILKREILAKPVIIILQIFARV